MMSIRAATGAVLLTFLAAACGKAEQDASDTDTATGGNAAQGGAPTAQSGGSAGAQSGGAGATAGAPSAAGNANECFPVAPSALTDFAPPDVVRDRLSAFLLEQPSSAPLPAQTTPEWAAELATSFVTDSPDPNPAFTRLFADWFSGTALQASVTTEREAELSAQALNFGARWSRTLSSHWDIRALLTHAPNDPPESVGVLTDPQALSLYNSILWRGSWVANALLCSQVPPEPLAPPSAHPMTRDQVIQLGAMPECAACHRYFDAAGFAFQQFDQLGNFSAAPADTSGHFVTVRGGAFQFSDIADLGAQLGSSCEVARCIASQFMSRAWERNGLRPSVPEDEFERVANRFAASGFSALELVRATAASPGMLAP